MLTGITTSCSARLNNVLCYFRLEEGGATALGPALLVATMMASQQAGSKVIICTDGLANVGLGRLDISTAEVQGNSLDFYESVAESASDKG